MLFKDIGCTPQEAWTSSKPRATGGGRRQTVGLLHCRGRSRWRLSVLMIGVLFAGGSVPGGVVDSHGRLERRLSGLLLLSEERGATLKGAGPADSVVGAAACDWQAAASAGGRSTIPPRSVTVRRSKGPARRYDARLYRFCYGHIWGRRWRWSRHVSGGALIGSPIWSWLYVHAQDVPKLPRQHRWVFQTKLQQAGYLVLMAVETSASAGKEVAAVADGAPKSGRSCVR